jgi:hypothetical protein
MIASYAFTGLRDAIAKAYIVGALSCDLRGPNARTKHLNHQSHLTITRPVRCSLGRTS